MSRTLYLTASRLAELASSLTPRDRAILVTLRRLRVATAVQLERLHFEGVGVRASRLALASLTQRRLVARLPRVVGGVRAGSAGYVYALDVAGWRLADPGRRPVRPWPIGTAFLAHSLSVTELYVRLVEQERAGGPILAEFAGEPACWRSFAGPGGGRVWLKPDALAALRLGGFEDRWFIEMDRATESLATIARKCETYRRYWQSGVEQARTGVFPQVLWIVPDERRAGVVAEVCGRQPAEAWQLFAVATGSEAVNRLAMGAAS
jgi:Replication-relaxation